MQAISEKPKRNTATGKSENDYQARATEVGRWMHINTMYKMVCAKLGLYTVAHLVLIPTPLPAGIDPDRVDAYLLEHSENPLEIAKLWQQAVADADA